MQAQKFETDASLKPQNLSKLLMRLSVRFLLGLYPLALRFGKTRSAQPGFTSPVPPGGVTTAIERQLGHQVP